MVPRFHTFMTACVLNICVIYLFSSIDGIIILPSLIKVILWKIKPIGFYSKESDLSSITFFETVVSLKQGIIIIVPNLLGYHIIK